MIPFVMHAAFLAGWDAMIALAAMNAVILVPTMAFVLAPALAGAPAWLGLAGLGLWLVAAVLWWSTCVWALKDIDAGESLSAATVLAAVRSSFLPGLQMAAFGVLPALGMLASAVACLLRGSLAWLAAGATLFWLAVALAAAAQYYVPLRARLGGTAGATARKAALMFVDNPLFSLFLLVYQGASLALSAFTAFLVPGIAGGALTVDVALRLRLYKYDWLESQGGKPGAHVPWDELLVEEKERVGTRSLRNLIFPWKD